MTGPDRGFAGTGITGRPASPLRALSCRFQEDLPVQASPLQIA
jgi:hypothetical protein